VNIRTELVRGEPLQVNGRRLVPLVRRTSGVHRRARFGQQSTSAGGGGFVLLHPVGLVEQRGEKEVLVPVPDKTVQALLGMLVAGIVLPLILAIGVRLARR
jgi:hypothetical protein